MAGISVNPDVLMQAAQGVGTSAQDMGDQLGKLQTTMTTDNPWGRDEQGSAFGMLYTAVLGEAMGAMGSHLEKLVQGAEGLAAWAQQMAQTEQTVTRQVTTAGQVG